MKSRTAVLVILLVVVLAESGCAVYRAMLSGRGTTVEGVIELPDGRTGPAGPFVVYLEGASPVWHARERAGADVRHDGEAFRPALAVARAGEGLEVRNRSGVHHRLFWFAGGRRLAVALGPERRAVARLELADPGVAHIYCELHPDEHITALAVPTPHYALVEEAGPFAIDSVPPGSWRLHLWSEHFAPGSREIEVQAFETSFHHFRLDSPGAP